MRLNRLFVTSNGSPLPLSGPPTLSLHALLTAARISFQDSSLDIDDIESMCASLMDQVSSLSSLFDQHLCSGLTLIDFRDTLRRIFYTRRDY